MSLIFAAPEEVPETVTESQMEKLAEELGAQWNKLALELNYGDDEIEYIKSSDKNASESDHALRLLKLFLVSITNFGGVLVCM